MSRVIRQTLPRGIVPFKVSDKQINEQWDKNRSMDLANIPTPSRILLLGSVNSGKSTVCKNLIVHQDPPFDEVYLVHPTGGKEYEDLDCTEIFKEVPNLEWFDDLPTTDDEGNILKRAIIIDDLKLQDVKKERADNLDMLMRHISSHRGITVYCCFQRFFGTPVSIRDLANVFILWNPLSKNEVSTIANRVGLESADLVDLFTNICEDPRDSICVDRTLKSPAPLRFNIWEPIVLS